MNELLRKDSDTIIKYTINAVLPDNAVRTALQSEEFTNNPLYDGKSIHVIAIGKAAWQMANAAYEILRDKIKSGIVITKYDHVTHEIPGFVCYEAGHPIPDENSFKATESAIELASNLSDNDLLLFLISGGGSALFEKPMIDPQELASITDSLLSCGANIVEINTIRKRLSAVKGGRFANIASPAQVFSIVLSDIIGDPLDMIASGPAYPDSSSSEDAWSIVNKYSISLSDEAASCLDIETPKSLDNVKTVITGSVRNLTLACAQICEELGYETTIFTDKLCCEAREAGSFLSSIAYTQSDSTINKRPRAYIAGGETVVHLTGKGKGGRNQELALSSAVGIDGLHNVAIFSVGSDGTDGPTDAAGGYVDGDTLSELIANNIDVSEILKENDAYTALNQINSLIFTGPTGTNVNDFSVILIR